MEDNYYEILGLPTNSSAQQIRKAYLKASLLHHPDKNLGNVEEAREKFVRVGQAYEVLGDPSKRAAYDRKMAAWKFRTGQARPSNACNAEGESQSQPQQKTTPADFRHYMNKFDETVGGMSREELNVALGAAAVVGSIVGSIIGARVGGGKSSFVSSLASMAGSAVGSRAASTLVETIADDSTQRIIEKGEREAAIARGERVREPTEKEVKERVCRDAGNAFTRVLGGCSGLGLGCSDTGTAGNRASGGPRVNLRDVGMFVKFGLGASFYHHHRCRALLIYLPWHT